MGFFALYNYETDYYKVFGNDYKNIVKEPNQNAAKMNYILSNKNRYDSFILGSSRVGQINPENLKNGKYYNFTYAEGIPNEHLSNIKGLLKNKVKIKNIILGLDEFSYEIKPESHKNDLLKMPYPNRLSEKPIFYSKYLILKPQTLNKKQFEPINFDITKTGMTLHSLKEEEIDKDPKTHLLKFINGKPVKFDDIYREKTITEIKEIVQICHKNNIKLTVFINPVQQITYKYTNMHNFNRFKKELAEITDFYDFSGFNKITTNNILFYEASHYRPIVGDMIAKILSKKNKKNNCYDFGVYVSQNNIDSHIKCLIKNYKKGN